MTIRPPLFLIGAGFNVDAAAEAGPVGLPSTYPLVHQLANICFGLSELPSDRSIEELLAEAIASKNRGPIDKLYDSLMQADYYLAGRLSGPTFSSSYRRFLSRFSRSHFLTFNYDSLLEVMLFQLRQWRPEDGYGVPVQAQLRSRQPDLPLVSTNSALHLHGSLCVYTSEFQINWAGSRGRHFGMIEPRDRPLFAFDADSIGTLFPHYDRVLPMERYHSLDERVIAPVPNKAPELQGAFVKNVYQRAQQLLSGAERVVSIGYRFNPHDRESFDPILQALAAKPGVSMVLVSPDASEIRYRLTVEYPRLRIEALPFTFRTWVSDGFPGVA